MIGKRPSPVRRLLPGGVPRRAESLFEQHASCRFYGHGKGALRDAVEPFVDPGERALLPAYLPDVVAEPFADVGLDPEYYAVTESLGPDLDDLTERIDDETGVLVSVNYFGFPTASWAAAAALADEHDCLHVDNASHSAFSVVDGTLLGTRGDVGFASLRKLLSTPDGAVLYAADGFDSAIVPSEYAGRRDRFTSADAATVGMSAAKAALSRREGLLRALQGVVNGGPDDVTPPGDRYEASKVPMSRLSSALLARTDPAAVRGRRRANYVAWDRGLSDRASVEPVFDDLAPGVCPQVYPVRAAAPGRFLTDLHAAGVDGADTWPLLPASVRSSGEYPTARRLADEVVRLPVHQQIAPDEIADACRALTS
ncbi:MAG: DegT/DnrJ/EryC1/StrS family aminotransferase [Halosimplex sp.]